MRRFPNNPRSLFPNQPPSQASNQSLLSKLFQSNNQAETLSRFSRNQQATPSLLQSITDPGKINQFLGRTEQVIKTAQQIKPVVEQYGPVVKNLPSMFKVLRAFNEHTPEQSSPAEKPKQAAQNKKSEEKGISRPKLYV